MNLPVPLEFLNIAFGVLAFAVAFVWSTLNQRIAAEDRRVEERALSEVRALATRLNQHEQLNERVVEKLDMLNESLRRLELRMADGYVTKAELNRIADERGDRLTLVEGMMGRLAQRMGDHEAAERARNLRNRRTPKNEQTS